MRFKKSKDENQNVRNALHATQHPSALHSTSNVSQSTSSVGGGGGGKMFKPSTADNKHNSNSSRIPKNEKTKTVNFGGGAEKKPPGSISSSRISPASLSSSYKSFSSPDSVSSDHAFVQSDTSKEEVTVTQTKNSGGDGARSPLGYGIRVEKSLLTVPIAECGTTNDDAKSLHSAASSHAEDSDVLVVSLVDETVEKGNDKQDKYICDGAKAPEKGGKKSKGKKSRLNKLRHSHTVMAMHPQVEAELNQERIGSARSSVGSESGGGDGSHSSQIRRRVSFLSMSEGFFKRGGRKKGKENKAKEKDGMTSSGSDLVARLPGEGSEESRSNASEEHQSKDMLVDEEGFSIPPHLANKEEEENRWSSDDSDGDEPRKIHVKIKPLNAEPAVKKSGSMDELRDVVGTLMKPPTPTGGLLSYPTGFSDNFNKTMPGPIPKSKTVDGSGEKDPWAPTTSSGRKLLQPSYTGDGRLNNFSSAGRLANNSMPSWPIHPEMTGPRQRPRPKGQTQMISLVRQNSSELDYSSMDMSFGRRTTSMSSLGEVPELSSLSPRLSPSINSPIPVAMALTETVHALFHGSDIAKGRIRVFGSVHVSFPGSSLSFLLQDDAPTLLFRLAHAEKVHALIPNKAVLSADAVSAFSSSASHTFSFSPSGLAFQLKKLCDQRPGAPFYNLEVLRYEVRNPVAPLLLVSFWKCDANQTDLRVDYQLNNECPVDHALLNLQFLTPVNGGKTNITAKPECEWVDSGEKLLWKLTELSKHGESSGSLKARIGLSKGPSTPSGTLVQFQVTEACLSGAGLEVDCEKFRLSLLKRKLVSGKYVCEPETR